MMTTDPIADMLTRIRNSIVINRKVVTIPYSKLRENTLQVMKDSGFIADFKVVKAQPQSTLTVTIAGEDEPIKITNLSRASKPGRRMYVKCQDIPKVKNGRGITIISTPQGIMTGDQARQEGIGGELLCRVY